MPFFDDVESRVDRIRDDVGKALRGEKISEETHRELAEAVKDHLEGRTRVEIPVNDRVSVEGRKERDGSVHVGIKVEF